jgi:DnaJ domain
MSSALFTPVCSIAPTRRRRFLWAAWWTAAPTKKPFRKPDASEGGARTRADALRAAERAAGRSLVEIESGWARAWASVLVGKDPWAGQARSASAESAPPLRARSTSNQPSVWATLGLEARATVSEIKAAYRKRAFATHPDRGGTADAFRALQSAYESALKRRARPTSKPKPR